MSRKRTVSTSNQMIYVGPTIPHVVKQNTSYLNGLPDPLLQKMEQQPAIKGLVIPLDEYPEALRQLREGQGPIYRLFCAVQTSL